MATPVGHYLLGLSISQVFVRDQPERYTRAWLASIACFADLDVVPGLLVGNLSAFHHGASHSALAAITFALIGLGVVRRFGYTPSFCIFSLLFFLYASHILLDFITLDTGFPYGVPVFWPWMEETFQSPWLLLPSVYHTRAPLLSLHNVLLMVQEVLIFFPLVGLSRALKISREPSYRKTWYYGVWFLLAVWLSVFSLSEP